MNKKTDIKKHFLLFLCVLFLFFSVLFFSVHLKLPTEKTGSISGRMQIHVQVDSGTGFQRILSNTTGRICSNVSTYNLSEVIIEVNEDRLSLEDAISKKIISPESVYAQALLDSQNKVCQVCYSSNLGLSEFVFLYEEYEVLIRHDIFEAANGIEYLVNDLTIAAPGEAKKLIPGYSYSRKDGTSLNLLAENWGIKWDVKEISSTSLTAKCSQYDGQQLGNLEIISFSVFDHNWVEHPFIGDRSDKSQFSIQIPMNTTSELFFDWSSLYGSLNAGEYYLYILVQDKYDSIHPFTKKYSDIQQYYIPFTLS